MKALVLLDEAYHHDYSGNLTLADQAALSAAAQLKSLGVLHDISVVILGASEHAKHVIEHALSLVSAWGIHFFDEKEMPLLIQARVLCHWVLHERMDVVFTGDNQLNVASMLASLLKQPLLLGVQKIDLNKNQQWVIQQALPTGISQCLLNFPGVFVFDKTATCDDLAVANQDQKNYLSKLIQRIPINTLPIATHTPLTTIKTEVLPLPEPGIKVPDSNTFMTLLMSEVSE